MSSPTKFWEGMLAATGQDQLNDDPRFSQRLERIKHQDDLIEILTPVFATKTRDEWCALLADNEVPHSPAYDSNEALEDPQARHLNIKIDAPSSELGTFTTVRPPYNFDGMPELDVLPPPVLDEHGDDIRAELVRRKAS